MHGANAETAEEIQKALRFRGDSKSFEKFLFMIAFNARHRHEFGYDTAPFILDIANAFCMQTDYKFHNSYKQLLHDRFLAELFAVDFKENPAETIEKINQWCSKQTRGEIKEFMSDVNLDTRAVIMNAVYFKARWEEVFDPEDTMPERFWHADGSTSFTPMVRMYETEFGYYEPGDFKVLLMPYTGNAHMLILLPDREDGLASLEKSLTARKLQQIYRRIEPELVDVRIPRFEFEHTGDLTPALQKMGIKTAFNDTGKADFSKVTDAEKLFVSGVQQKAMIRVDEEGTVAASITAISWGSAAMDEEEEEEPKIYTFYADRPFMFLICEDTDGSILFMGRVHHPEKVDDESP